MSTSSLLRTVLPFILVVSLVLAATGGVLLYPQYAPMLFTKERVEQLRAQSVEGCVAWWVPQEHRKGCLMTEMGRTIDRDGPAAVIELDTFANTARDLGAECHVMMHTVSMEYAQRRSLTPRTVATHFPDSSDTNCAAGFTHGLLTGVVDKVQTGGDARAAQAACTRIGQRMAQKNCLHGLGHSFLRARKGDADAAMRLCAALGPQGLECAPGALHEIGFGKESQVGAHRTNIDSMRDYCMSRVPDQFLDSCWLRALQFEPIKVAKGADSVKAMHEFCSGLEARHVSPCITGAAFTALSEAKQPTIAVRCSVVPPGLYNACVKSRVFGARSSEEGFMVCDRASSEHRASCIEQVAHGLAVMHDGRVDCTVVPASFRQACDRGSSRVDEPIGVI